MKRIQVLFMLILCAVLFFPTSARADGGGWPTATPTVTPTSTPTSLPTFTPLTPTAATITPTTPYPYPAINNNSSGMITPPAITPLETTQVLDGEPLASPAKTQHALSLTGGVACFPIAIVALLVGLAVVNRLRGGGRKGA